MHACSATTYTLLYIKWITNKDLLYSTGNLTLKKSEYMYATATAKSLQSCPTLCNPIDSSPPGSSVTGILQARTLEWVAISFSRYMYTYN